MDRTTGKDLYSEKYNIRFYHIAKNGMTAMIKILELDWVAVEDINPNAKTIAIIRDPFERFISGCVRVWKSGDPNVYLDKLLNDGPWNGHHLSQHYYLNEESHGRHISNVDHFVLFENMNNELHELGINNIVHLNSTKWLYKDKVREIISPRKIEILELYQEDTDLWKKLKGARI